MLLWQQQIHHSDTASDIQHLAYSAGRMPSGKGDTGRFEIINAFTTLCASWGYWWGQAVNHGLVCCITEEPYAETGPQTGSHSGLRMPEENTRLKLMTVVEKSRAQPAGTRRMHVYCIHELMDE